MIVPPVMELDLMIITQTISVIGVMDSEDYLKMNCGITGNVGSEKRDAEALAIAESQEGSGTWNIDS